MERFTSIGYPVRIHAGQDALDALPAEIDRAGASRALIVCGRSIAEKTPLIDRMRALLGTRLAGVFPGMRKDAPLEDVRAAVAAAQDCRADILLAVGAGSVLKATRIVAILLAETGPVDRLVTQYPQGLPPFSPRLNAAKLPIVNILTAATSAQNRAGAALKHAAGGYRMEFFDPKTRPRAIFWDAGALLTAPQAMALSTAFSVYWRALMNIGALADANPLVQGSRRQAFLLARDAIERVDDPEGAAARIDLCAAALLQNRDEDDGGRPFDAHWIARVVYALAAATFHFVDGVDQGHANAVLTPSAIRHFGGRCPEATMAIGRAVDHPHGANEPGSAPGRVSQTVAQVFKRLGMPARLRDLGVDREDLPGILKLSLKNFNADRDRRFHDEQELLAAVLTDAW